MLCFPCSYTNSVKHNYTCDNINYIGTYKVTIWWFFKLNKRKLCSNIAAVAISSVGCMCHDAGLLRISLLGPLQENKADIRSSVCTFLSLKLEHHAHIAFT